jgi:hypothetical protein
VDYREYAPYAPQYYPPNVAIPHGTPGHGIPEGMHDHPGMTPVPYTQELGLVGPCDPYGAIFGNSNGNRKPVRATQVRII